MRDGSIIAGREQREGQNKRNDEALYVTWFSFHDHIIIVSRDYF